MAVITCNLWAKKGRIKFPDGVEVPFWGFATAAGGEPQLPGPVITAEVGDNIEIILHNNLAEIVSLVFPGQDFIPVPVKENGVFASYNTPASPGNSVTYTLTAVRPGVFLYESGTRPEIQVPMGLYGALLIYPRGYKNPGHADYQTAYGNNSNTEYDIEQILVLSEVDSRLNRAVDSGNTFNLLDFEPDYWLVNGRSFPFTLLPDNMNFLVSQTAGSRVNAAPGKRVLLRCINAGVQNHTFRCDNITPRVVAVDSWPLMAGTGSIDATYQKNTITVASGESYDLLFTADTLGHYYLYDRDFQHLCNVNQFPGGMAARLDVIPVEPTEVPAAPSNFTCSLYCHDGVLLHWNRSTNAEGYVVERRTGAGNFETLSVQVAPELTEYKDNTVLPAAGYTYRVFAYNALGVSNYSNQCSLSTHDLIAGPGNLTCNAASERRVDLAWQDNAYNENGYLVERSTGGNDNYQVIAGVGTDTEFFSDTTVQSNTRYYYRVRAFNSTVFSCYSNSCAVVTPTDSPQAPSNLRALHSPILVILIWDDNSLDEVEFLIERKTGYDGNYIQIGKANKNTRYYLDFKISRNTTYFYRIRAYSHKGYSDYSNEIRVIIN